MRKFLFRVGFITVIRFFVLTSLLTSLIYLETSPFPQEATIVVLSYLIHIGVTFLFAKWAFAKEHAPTWREAGIVAAFFVLLGTLLELGLQFLIVGGSFFATLLNLTWQSLFILALYVLTVYVAAWETKTARMKRHMPEGMQ